MTSKLTREWLQHQISAIEGAGITDSNTLAAFKLALAAMSSKPVVPDEVMVFTTSSFGTLFNASDLNNETGINGISSIVLMIFPISSEL